MSKALVFVVLAFAVSSAAAAQSPVGQAGEPSAHPLAATSIDAHLTIPDGEQFGCAVFAPPPQQNAPSGTRLYEFLSGDPEAPARTIHMEVNGDDRIAGVAVTVVHWDSGQASARMIAIAAGFRDSSATGLLIVTQASATGRSDPATIPTTSSRRLLTTDELVKSRKLADWLFLRRCSPPSGD